MLYEPHFSAPSVGGTESLGITAGETKNPSKNMPRVVKLVFWRIMIFYVLTILIIGLNGTRNNSDFLKWS